jgi:MoxR-like ATPase
MRIGIGYPHQDDELAILRTHGGADRMAELQPVTDAATVAATIRTIRTIRTAEPVERYIVALCRATRSHPDVELGASPRASVALLRASRTAAAVAGRAHVTPDDVKKLAPHVLPHRLILHPEAELAGHATSDVIADILDGLPAPTE